MNAREKLTALLLPLCEGVADCWRTDPKKHCSVLIDDVLTVMSQDDARGGGTMSDTGGKCNQCGAEWAGRRHGSPMELHAQCSCCQEYVHHDLIGWHQATIEGTLKTKSIAICDACRAKHVNHIGHRT
mgnify:CR=1 FL=1